MPDIYNIEGTALTDSGSPAAGRTVRIHNRTTWELIRTLTTDSSGQFKTIMNNNLPVTVVLLVRTRITVLVLCTCTFRARRRTQTSDFALPFTFFKLQLKIFD